MRRSLLVPFLACALSGCTLEGIFTRVKELLPVKEEPRPEMECPSGATQVGGVAPAEVEKWWRAGGASEDAGLLVEFWPFEPDRTMNLGDAHWLCVDAKGRRTGPYYQERTSPSGEGAWVEGAFTADQPDGDWKGGWNVGSSESAAFQGRYEGGERTGTWTFQRDGAVRASGEYIHDRMWGGWRFFGPAGTVFATFTAGRLHGPFERTNADGTREKGHYFEGKRHGTWITGRADAVSGGLTEDQRTVWKDGVQVSASLPNEPHPERFVPKASAEVDHVVRAWMEAGLGGGWSSVASLRTFAVLNDYASASVSRQVALDGISVGEAWSLVSDWKVKRVEPGTQGTKVLVALNVVCRIDETGRPAALRVEVPLTMEIVEDDGMWKPISPPGPLDVLYRSYYLSHLTQRGDGHYRLAVKDCADADPSKPKVVRSRSPQGPKRTKPMRRAPMPRKRPATQ